MTWFKVDDGLHSNRKRVRAGHEAMGLWVIAGSWCSDELTDGWIPDDVIDYLVPVVGADLAKRLERAGFWHRVTRDGEEGWQFHDWDEYQPSKERVLAERSAAADRQARARERARQKRAEGSADASEQPEVSEPSRRDSRATDDVSHGAVTVPPTRPDPTRTYKDSPNGESYAPRKTRRPRAKIPDDFTVTSEMVEWARAECPLVDGRRATDAFVDHFVGTGDVKADWNATWRNWLRRDQADAERRHARASPGNVVALNGQRRKSPGEENVDDWLSVQMPSMEVFK